MKAWISRLDDELDELKHGKVNSNSRLKKENEDEKGKK